MKTEEEEIEKINSMSHIEMARLWRFAPSGHKYFDSSLPYFDIFGKRFKTQILLSWKNSTGVCSADTN